MTFLYRLWGLRWLIWSKVHQPSFDRHFWRDFERYKREVEARHGHR